jgi:uncharacterized protein (TIGR02594 family)
MSFCLQRGLRLGPLLVACGFCIVTMTSIADARPSKRGGYVQVPQGASEFSSASQYPNSISASYAASDRPRRRARRMAAVDPSSSGSWSLIAEARRWIGTNPTGRSSLWCGHFMNFVLSRTGYRAHNSNVARSFAFYGRRLSGPQIGAIAVMSRGRDGGHVGIISGIISGNVNNRVEEIAFPRRLMLAYVTP